MKMYIGIDPDTEKNGVALWIPVSNELELYNFTFFELFDFLQYLKDDNDNNIEVVIEAGWLNKSNWHTLKDKSANLNAKIGSKVGANHETGRKIVEMCDYLKIQRRLVKPTRSKVDAKHFKLITRYDKRTNQEQRDAAMLVYKLT